MVYFLIIDGLVDHTIDSTSTVSGREYTLGICCARPAPCAGYDSLDPPGRCCASTTPAAGRSVDREQAREADRRPTSGHAPALCSRGFKDMYA